MHLVPTAATILMVGAGGAAPIDDGDLNRLGLAAGLVRLPGDGNLVAACRQRQPDLLLLNTRRVEDAGPLVAGLRAADLPFDPAILVVGAGGDAAQRTRLLDLGAWDVLPRATEKGELLAKLASCLRIQAQRRHALAQVRHLEGSLADRSQRLTEVVELLRQAERRLSEQADRSRCEIRLRSEAMASAALELRTPLHAIIGFADLIREQSYGPAGDPRYPEYANDIHQAAQHMLSLVEGTLDLARVDTEQQALDMRVVDVGRAVRDTTRALQQMAEGTGVRLQVKLPDTPLRIRTDPDKVKQIVLNLASNAIKFTPPGGLVTVEVQAAPDGGAAIMVIRDTGIGIAPKDLPTALRPFGQVRAPGQAAPKGSGLGLPLTRRYVEMLGGVLEISSQPGKGTVVLVRLPLGADDTAHAPQASAATA